MNVRRRLSLILALLPLFLLVPMGTRAFAQQNSLISGLVNDPAGAALPGASVTLTEESTGYTSKTVTNDSGYFSFPGLNPGKYDMSVSAKGFQTKVDKGLALNVSQTLRVDQSLVVGDVSTTVEVTADQLTVQTDSNVVSTLVSAEQIQSIATENRNFAALVALGMGVSSNLPDSNVPTSIGSSAAISVNGLRQTHNIWLVDGGEADDRGGAGGSSIEPSQDAIAEIETLASNYPPDYGISSGATISLSLKSGTQRFHGGAWEFNRNTVFNANAVGNKQASPVGVRPKLNYNIYGFNIGGPIFIPKVYNEGRNKTFFFWNEEWRKLIQGSGTQQNNTLPAADFPTAGTNLTYVSPKFAATPIVPTVPQNVGDPALLAKFAADGLTPGQPFPGNVIPANLFDPNAVIYLNTGIVPKPNAANDQFIGQASLPIDVRDDIVRIDHRVNDKWQILGHYLHDAVSQTSGAPMIGWSGGTWPTITSVFVNPSYSAAVKITGQLSSNMLLEASLNYDGNQITITNSTNGNLPSGFSTRPFFANGATSIPGMQWNGVYGVQEKPGSAPWKNAANDYEPKVDLSYTKGKHQMKFGFSWNKYDKNQKLFLDAEGDYTFNNQSGDPFLDMLLGLSASYSQSQAAPIRHYVNNTPSAYAMDTWHVTSRLSLQLGFRYDGLPHAYELNNLVSNFNPNHYVAAEAPQWNNGPGGDGSLITTNTIGANTVPAPGFANYNGGTFYLNGVDLAGVNGVPHGLVSNDYNTWQPRVGFSDDIFGDGKTVLRGGFGTFYERLQGNDIYNAATAAPFANTPSANNVYFSTQSKSWVTGGTAATPSFAQGSTTLAQTYKAPAVAQYSLGVQHQLAPSVIWIVQYVGNIAWHQNIERQINNYSLNTPLIAPNTNTSLGNNYQYYTRANAGDPNNNSGYNPGGHSIPVADQLRVYNGFGAIDQQENTTNGTYNGFQTGVRSQGYHGLSGEVDYTWSHEIDITSNDLQNVGNPYNLKYDKGSGAFDRRQILSINYIYKLPIFRSSGLVHNALGGWELAGTAVFSTGPVINNGGANIGTHLSINYDPVGLGGGYTNRPNVVGKVKYNRNRGGWLLNKNNTQWFNTAQFSAPIPAWAGGANQGFGDAGKDAVIGPGRVNFTTSLYKTFVVHEGINFQFRFETFNTFNHSEAMGVNNNYGQGTFGQVNSFYDPRNLQFGGKFNF
jgi:hypothetical protein